MSRTADGKPPRADGNAAETPPRAFTQGVGTVFQFVGVLLFLGMMFVCCTSGLFSKNVAQRPDLQAIGWRLPGQSAKESPAYSVPRATTLSVTCGVFFGVALAGIGLGLQAQNRVAPVLAVVLTTVGTLFWLLQTVFVVQKVHSLLLTLLVFALVALFAGFTALSIAAWREMRRNPPPVGHELLPADYKVPYSHVHQDPPEVGLAQELEQRRERLALQQKELELLEEKLKRKLDEKAD